MISLVIADEAMLDAAIAGSPRLGELLDAQPAEGWASFAESLPRVRDALRADPGFARWGTRLFVLEEPRTLVGWGGFKGPPRNGAVELGYEIAPSWQNRGLATQAVAAMLEEAFADPGVTKVLAHTLPRPSASTRVLEKAGFEHDMELPGGPEGKVWRFRLSRPG